MRNSNVFEDVFDFNGDIKISDLEKVRIAAFYVRFSLVDSAEFAVRKPVFTIGSEVGIAVLH